MYLQGRRRMPDHLCDLFAVKKTTSYRISISIVSFSLMIYWS